MHNAFDLWSVLVNLDVQQGFAGAFFASSNLFASHVDCADIFRLQKPFAVHCRSAKNFIVADPVRNVAIVGGSKSFIVNPLADFTDFLFGFVNVNHKYLAG